MTYRPLPLFILVAAFAGLAQPTFAGQTVIQPSTALQGLSPERLAAIRAVGRNVLAAKKSGGEDVADAEQLARLRDTVDRLIAAERDPGGRTPITIQGQEGVIQRRTQENTHATKAAALADARALAGQLRQHADLMDSRVRTDRQADTTSAGLPIGEQRARQFARWAQEIDESLADDRRTARLLELRGRLQATRRGLSDVPLPGTPTLQAMPSTSETPIRAVETTESTQQAAPAGTPPAKPKTRKKARKGAQS